MAKGSKSGLSSWMSYLLLGTNLIFVVGLLMSFLGGFINPNLSTLLAFAALCFPFFLLINICFFIYYLASFRVYCLFSLCVILLNIDNIKGLVQFRKPHFEDREDVLKLVTYNVNLFDYYSLRDKHKGEIKEQILGFIEDEMPDIVCFQEYLESKIFPISPILKQKSGLKYKTQIRNNGKISYGCAIYSKYKIINEGQVDFQNNSIMSCIFADIVMKQDTFRIYNMHLESIRFNKEDELFYNNFTEVKSSDAMKKGVRRMARKMHRAYKKRAVEALAIQDHASTSPYSVIICGDMNDTPASFAYRSISNNMRDAFKTAGFGLGTTYNGLFPAFRIDYVFYNKPLKAVYFKNVHLPLSDHFPIITELELPQKENIDN